MHPPTMASIGVTLCGMSPLICNRPAEVTDGRSPREQAEARLYLDHELKPVIPHLNLVRCLLNAGAGIGRQPAELVHALGVAQSAVRIDSTDGWLVDSRTVRDPRTGDRRPAHRPRFDAWRLRFDLLVDPELLQLALAERLVAHAGIHVGLGDFRPERRGPYGRFRIEHWSDGDGQIGAPSPAPLATATH